MAVVKYEENGQAYFEWLEELTIKEYVEIVENSVKKSIRVTGKEPIVNTSVDKKLVSTEIFDGLVLTTVFFNTDSGFFHKRDIDLSDYLRFKDLDAILKSRGDQ